VNSTTSSVSQALDEPDIMEQFGNEKGDQADHVSEEGSHDLSVEHPTINERKLVLEIDLRILPILCIVYLMAFIDRCVASPHIGVRC